MGDSQLHEYSERPDAGSGDTRGGVTSGPDSADDHVQIGASKGPTTKRQACTECRQAKIRCDATTLPCARCQRLRHVCRIDANYKRVNKKRKVDELEAELQQLRAHAKPIDAGLSLTRVTTASTQSVISNGADAEDCYEQDLDSVTSRRSHRAQSTAGLMTTYNNVGLEQDLDSVATRPSRRAQSNAGLMNTYNNVGVAVHPDNQNLEQVMSGRAPAKQDRSLDFIVLKKTQIDLMFLQYFEHYHSYLCILDPLIAPDDYYDDSPLLFWSIIGVVARRYSDEPSLLAALSTSVSRLLWAAIAKRPHTRQLVEAILLQLTWPFPTNSMWTENTYVLSGIAVLAATQLGLHQPEKIQDFARTKTRLSDEQIRQRAKIWAACNIISQSCASWQGNDCVKTFDWTVSRCLVPGTAFSIPTELQHHLIIERFSHRVMDAVSSERANLEVDPSRTQAKASMMIFLERDLDEIESQIIHETSDINKIYLGGVRLNLLVYHFFDPPDSAHRKQGLLKAYAVAGSIITRLGSEPTGSQHLKYGPLFLYHSLALTAVVLLRILQSNYSLYIDVEEGKHKFNMCMHALRRYSVALNDLPARCAEVLSQLWHGLEASSSGRIVEPELRLWSRSGASIVHDSLWLWRENFDGQANAYPSPNSSVGPDAGLNALPSGNDFLGSLGWLWDADMQLLDVNLTNVSE